MYIQSKTNKSSGSGIYFVPHCAVNNASVTKIIYIIDNKNSYHYKLFNKNLSSSLIT
jgi:hypothetical protein